ncbi:Endo-1,4-beta-xylanase A precursor [compost metagenome]
MPEGSRHGTVIPVTRSEYQLLQSEIPGIEEPNTDVRVTGLTLAPAQLTLKEGDVQQLTAVIAPADASNKSILWSSSREDIVKVDEAGRLTALKEGAAVISAASADGGFIAVSRLTVEKKPASNGGTDPGTSPGNGGNSGNGSNPGSGTNPGANNGSGGGTGNGEEGSGAGSPSFTDTNGHWAAAAIRKLTEKGILGGFPDGSFKPDKQMSRAEFAAVMFRMLGLDASHADSAFTDVAQDAWYSEYVNGLHALGYVNGFEDGGFRPNQPLTREEAFVILYRAMKGRLPAAETAKEPSFQDEGAVSDWAQEAVRALAKTGMIKGYADGTLKPKSTITRAEIAAIAAAFLEVEQ